MTGKLIQTIDTNLERRVKVYEEQIRMLDHQLAEARSEAEHHRGEGHKLRQALLSEEARANTAEAALQKADEHLTETRGMLRALELKIQALEKGES